MGEFSSAALDCNRVCSVCLLSNVHTPFLEKYEVNEVNTGLRNKSLRAPNHISVILSKVREK